MFTGDRGIDFTLFALSLVECPETPYLNLITIFNAHKNMLEKTIYDKVDLPFLYSALFYKPINYFFFIQKASTSSLGIYKCIDLFRHT